jgi:two-component system sensor histidine kinase FlrB
MNCDVTTSREQPARQSALQQPENGELEHAFLLFNELSEKLATSYGDLETQVAYLSGELAEARSERLRQLAEKELLAKKLEGLLDALPAGIVVLDEGGIIRQANPVAFGMLGDAIQGQAWCDIAQQVLITQGDELRLRDGRWLSVSVRPLDDDPGKIILLADVTETHTLQAKLNRQQRLTSLGEMVASLAHQLRTPLAAALLYISTINHPASRDRDKTRFADKAKQRLQHLERMLNDMLIFARGDVAAAEYIDIDQLVDRLQQALSEQFVAAGVELDINNAASGSGICANHDVLLSVFQNLADNALDSCIEKFMATAADAEAPVATARLDIKISRTTDRQIAFKFIDNGAGMTGQLIERVLEPFFTTRSKGTGLGLAVVNASVESFHGKLNITSQPGEGSCFCITLPVARHNDVLPSGLVMPAAIEQHDTTDEKVINMFENKEVKK